MPRQITEAEARRRLAALIPPMDVYDEYVSREVWGTKDMLAFQKARELQVNILMYGDTGAGKSMAVEAFHAYHQMPLIMVNCNGGIDPNTFFGMLEMGEDGIIRWVDSDITLGMEYGPAGIFLDECNFTPPKTFSALHSALRQRYFTILERNNEKRYVHDESWFIGAYNPEDSYTGTRPLNPAFRNRFAVKIPWDYDRSVEAELTSLPIMLDIAYNLRDQRREGRGDFDTPVSTNMLMEFEELGMEISVDFAVGNFIAAFAVDEQDAVKEVLKNERHNIDAQFAELRQRIDDMNKKGAK
jgi:hypothetical protein